MVKFLKPSMRPQIADIKAAIGWGVAGGAGALYLVQIRPDFYPLEATEPWDYIRKTFFEKPEELEQK